MSTVKEVRHIQFRECTDAALEALQGNDIDMTIHHLEMLVAGLKRDRDAAPEQTWPPKR